MTFEDLKLNRQLLNAIEDLKWNQTTEIQEKAIPLVLAGHDLVGIAQTGTGKTAAYLLPILRKLNYASTNNPRALILAPTKELIIQIKEQIHELAKYTDLRCVALYGGIGPKAQMEEIKQGTDIIIATPGRLIDIYSRGALPTKEIKTMVMDEADRLMDMGFMSQIRSILEFVPNKRQNLLFSATFHERVEKLAGEVLKFPERVEVTPQATTATTITQSVYHTENIATKLNLMEFLLNQEAYSKVMVFVNSKKSADTVYNHLKKKVKVGIRVIHSNKGQNSRINAMKEFEEGEVKILIATDVSARGIDIDDVTHVFNYEIPYLYEEYVHRIGRTGRAFKNGIAISFANKAERKHLELVEEMIQQKIHVAKMPKEVTVPATPKEEIIENERQLDFFKRKADPTFKGAFHEKKFVIKEREEKEKKKRVFKGKSWRK